MGNHVKKGETDIQAIIEASFALILDCVDEAIHIVDTKGVTIYYNQVATEMEGLDAADVIGKNVLEVYPSLTLETSSLLGVLETGKAVLNKEQTIVSSSGKVVTIIYSTYPLMADGVLIGACDISKDITKIKELSERVVQLQSDLHVKTSGRKHPKVAEWANVAQYTFNDLIGSHPSLVRLKVLGQRVAGSNSPVLVYGETGTGKELVVQSIHNASSRKSGPFVAQNCAALPTSLLESILFGSVKGSFTGAEDRPGLFELANGGTLFMDEINSMPIELQGKLLRVLQEGTVRRLGDSKIWKVNTRVIATTNIDPEEAVAQKELRRDLYYRLNVVSLKVPPLRERNSDIIILTNYFIHLYNEKLNRQVHRISRKVKEVFFAYFWPGNVRELQHVIEHAMNIVAGSVIDLEDLPAYMLQQGHHQKHEDSIVYFGKESLSAALKRVEKVFIEKALKECGNNVAKAARQLDIPRQTLQYKIRTNKYFIE